MSRKLHQGEAKKLASLLLLNENLQIIESTLFFALQFQKTLSLQDWSKIQRSKQMDTSRDLKSKLYDTQFEIISMANDPSFNSEEGRIRLKSYQSLVNMLYERSIRISFEKSISEIIMCFKAILARWIKELNFDQKEKGTPSISPSVNDLENIKDSEDNVTNSFKPKSGTSNTPFVSLKTIPIEAISKNTEYEDLFRFQKAVEYEAVSTKSPLLKIQIQILEDKKSIEFLPTLDDWNKEIMKTIENVIEEIKHVECLRTKDIGPARSDHYMRVFVENDFFLNECKNCILSEVGQLFLIAEIFKKKASEFTPIIFSNGESVKKKLKKATHGELKKEISKFQLLSLEAERVFYYDNLKVGLFIVDVAELKVSLLTQKKIFEKLKEWSQILYESIIFRINFENESVFSETEEFIKRLKKKPKDIEELDEQRHYISNVLPKELEAMDHTIKGVMKKLDLLDEMQCKIGFEDFAKSWSTCGLTQKIWRKKDNVLKKLKLAEKGFSDTLIKQQEDIIDTIGGIAMDVEMITKESDIERYNQVSNKYSDMLDRINKAITEGELINKREDILKWKLTDYSELQRIKDNFLPFHRVWSLARDYHFIVPNVMNGPISSLNRESITNDIIESWNELFKLEKTTFKVMPYMIKVILEVKKWYHSFKPYLPLINDLRNPALKSLFLTQKTALDQHRSID